MRCQLHRYDDRGQRRTCNVLAVSIWKARDGDLAVCEQCEAMIVDIAKGGTIAGVFEPIPE